MRLSKTQLLQVAISLLATVVFGVYFFSTIDLGALVDAVRSVNGKWFSVAVVLMVANTILRAMRIRLVVRQAVSPTQMSATCGVQNFLGMLLPSGLSQAVFLYLMKRVLDIGLLRSIAGVFALRIFDLAIFIVLALAAAFSLHSGFVPQLLWSAGVFAVILLVAGVIWGAIAAIPDSLSGSIVGKAIELLRSVTRDTLNSFGVLYSVEAVVLTALVWISLFACYGALCWAMDIHLTLMPGVLAFALLMLINLLPVHGIAGVGTHHLAWYLVLMAAGVGSAQAKLGAATSHLLLLALFALIAVPSYLLLMVSGSWARSNST